MTTGVKVSGVGRAEPGPLSSALAAADAGWHVFPCAPGSKRPALRENWQDLATTDPDRIRAWWARQPYNIGIACGPVRPRRHRPGRRPRRTRWTRQTRWTRPPRPPPGLDGPASGADALQRLCRAHGQRYPAGTYTVDTPSGGSHLYFTAPETPVRNSAGRLGPLIDVRADGGYVVGDGSRIGGRGYAARGDFLPLALPLPAWIARLLLGGARAARDHPAAAGARPGTGPGLRPGRLPRGDPPGRRGAGRDQERHAQPGRVQPRPAGRGRADPAAAGHDRPGRRRRPGRAARRRGPADDPLGDGGRRAEAASLTGLRNAAATGGTRNAARKRLGSADRRQRPDDLVAEQGDEPGRVRHRRRDLDQARRRGRRTAPSRTGTR